MESGDNALVGSSRSVTAQSRRVLDGHSMMRPMVLRATNEHHVYVQQSCGDMAPSVATWRLGQMAEIRQISLSIQDELGIISLIHIVHSHAAASST